MNSTPSEDEQLADVEALLAPTTSEAEPPSPSKLNGTEAIKPTNGANGRELKSGSAGADDTKGKDEGDDDNLKGEDEDDEEEDDEDDEDEDDEEEDMFVVEAIKKHMVDEKGNLKFQVKWEGYDSKKDLTWEPEENLAETASEVLDEYLEKVGGRQAVIDETARAAQTKKRGRQSSGANAGEAKRRRKSENHPRSTTPPATAKKWGPPSGSWEDEIEDIDACEEESSGKLMVYLNWKNGQKTKHETAVVYKKCPQKMLRFYERHVKIIRPPATSPQ